MVGAWNRSGLSARAFADARGVSPRSLSWWKWKLSKDCEGGAELTERSEALSLVPVEIVDADEDIWMGWELRTSAGHVLRVRGNLDRRDLESILATMLAAGGRRS